MLRSVNVDELEAGMTFSVSDKLFVVISSHFINDHRVAVNIMNLEDATIDEWWLRVGCVLWVDQ